MCEGEFEFQFAVQLRSSAALCAQSDAGGDLGTCGVNFVRFFTLKKR